MTIKTIAVLIAGACFAICPIISQANDASRIRYTPDESQSAPPGGQLGTAGVPGTQLRVLAGNPKQAGLYTVMIKLPKNTVIKPHSHPDDRVGTVVSGSFYFGFGDTFDESQLKKLPAGSFYTEPPGANHFAMTKDEETVVYVTGSGPTGTAYANPADDPSKK
jgi:quercetin dioxygenase-like cupin family protein